MGMPDFGGLFKPGEDYMIRARVADKDEHFDAGSHIRMRIGERGYFQTLWVQRGLILPTPSCLLRSAA